MFAINFPWIGRNPYKLGVFAGFLFGLFMVSSVVARLKSHDVAGVVSSVSLPIGLGIVFSVIGVAIRWRLDRISALPDSHRSVTYRSDCLLVHGAMQIPATLRIVQHDLMVHPLFGREVAVPLGSLTSMTPSRWFNGQYLFGPTGGFWLASESGRRFGIAVPDAGAFVEQLSAGSVLATM